MAKTKQNKESNFYSVMYLMNTYDGYPLALVSYDDRQALGLKDGTSVTYKRPDCDGLYDGVIKTKTFHKDNESWDCRFDTADKVAITKQLSSEPFFRDGSPILEIVLPF